MRLKELLFLLMILGITILVIVFSEIKNNIRPVPETIFIRVLDNEEPVIGALCRADIISKNFNIENKTLEEVGNIFDYVPSNTLHGLESEGYYKLKTGLSKQDKIFEIKIVCINPRAAGVSYTIINNTNFPCEMQEGGYWICL